MSTRLSTLPNGLRVLTDSIPDMHSVAIGIWCNVGTRYEDLKLNGIAHLVEHMIFKGTKHHNALEIVEKIETVGGQMNAYTSREQTAYYVHLLKDDMPLALELLGDIFLYSTFPEEELDKERHVILQEIGMTHDTPDDLVFDLYQAAAYPDQALGAPILGTADIVKSMPRDALFHYTQTFYRPDNLILSVAGNVDHDELLTITENIFGNVPAAHQQTHLAPASYQGGEARIQKDLEQAHIVLGFQGTARSADNYESALLLSTLLGGGMSSRLFQEVREKRGLVYNTYSCHSAYHDDGQFEIYAGTGPENLPELIPVICDELGKVQTSPVPEEELHRAKTQIRAGLLMSRESMLSRADRQAKYMFHFNKILDIDEIISKVEAVTPQDIQKAANQIFKITPTLAALGPLEHLEDYENIKKRLA